MKLNNGIPVEFHGIKATVFGGPYREYVPGTRRLVGVKMAKEITHPYDVSIPTADYSVPDVASMTEGLKAAFDAMIAGNDLYAGCMGGIGRTGLFMACLIKVAWALDHTGYYDDPVTFVRGMYKAHAVETQEQKKYVEDFDTDPVADHVMDQLDALGFVREVEIRIQAISFEYPPLGKYLAWWIKHLF